MSGQVFYEDVTEDTEVPLLVKRPTTRQLVMWAGGSGDFYDLHYDKDFAKAQGLDAVIVHGRLKAAFIGQMLTEWIGAEGTLKNLACRYRGKDYPGQEMVVRGKVTKKYVVNSEHCLELDVWTENLDKERTTSGSAVVVLPSRNERV